MSAGTLEHGGCHPRMPVRTSEPGSGCRADCLHRRSVQEYHAARHADELAREQETAGYTAETREYGGQMLTFKDWLIGGRTLPEMTP